MSVPVEGSLWERRDGVFRVEKVYGAKRRNDDGSLSDITLVKLIVVDPMPMHADLDQFLERYVPYDPDAE